MGLFDWAKSEAQDLGIIAPPAASSQGLDNGLDGLAAGSQHAADVTSGIIANNARDGAQQQLDQWDGAAIAAPLDAEIAADKNHSDTPPPNYWHTEDNPYYTQ